MLYDDGRVACDDRSLIIRVHCLWGSAKTIPYATIQHVERRPLTGLIGRWRIWGSGDFVHWWNLDTERPSKKDCTRHRRRDTYRSDDHARRSGCSRKDPHEAHRLSFRWHEGIAFRSRRFDRFRELGPDLRTAA